MYADVFPDGRVLPNDTIKYRGHPGAIFPRLPKDAAEAAKGWSWERDDDKITAKPVKADKGFRFETVTESPMNVDLPQLQQVHLHVRPSQGRITAAESANTQGYGFKGKGTGTTELLGVKAADADPGKQLAAEERGYFESVGGLRQGAARGRRWRGRRTPRSGWRRPSRR